MSEQRSSQTPIKGARALRNRQAIIDGASELIRTQGVQGTSIADVIAASKTSTGAIYHHFPNKEAIVVEVAHQTIQFPLDALAAYRDVPRSPATLFGYAMAALTNNPELGDLLVQLGAGAATDDQLGQQLRSEFAVLRDSVQKTLLAWAASQGVPPVKVLGLSQVLVGLVLGFATQHNLVGSFDEDSYLEQGLRLLTVETPDSPD